MATQPGFGAQFGIGCALFFGLVKLFDLWEGGLNEDARLEIAVWLLDVKVTPGAADRHSVFLKLFRAVCGTSSSTKRVIVASILTVANNFLSGLSIGHGYAGTLRFSVESLHFAFSLFLIMVVLNANEEFLARTFDFRALLTSVSAIALAVVAGVIGLVLWAGISFSRALSSPHLGAVVLRLSIVPALTVGIWMWLPTASGLLLRAARRLDIGLQWLKRRSDIEKEPLRCIGMVVAAITAAGYWAAVTVMRFL
jgi:hypothetical protein